MKSLCIQLPREQSPQRRSEKALELSATTENISGDGISVLLDILALFS
jgi:hypothetical protein